MEEFPPLSVRGEIQAYLRGCEHLLSAALMDDHTPFSQEEEGIIEYYALELLKIVPTARALPFQKYRQSVDNYVRVSEALLKVNDFNSHEKKLIEEMSKKLSDKLLLKIQGE
jgi:hypothetical protein